MKKNILLGMLAIFLASTLGNITADILIEDVFPLIFSRDRDSDLLKKAE